MRREIKNSRWLITGASRGIGNELAKLAGTGGARLALVARSKEALGDLEQELAGKGIDVRAFPADITREEDREKVFFQIKEHFGELDVLVNNAGIGTWNHFIDGTEQLARDIMEVNFFAPAEMIRQAIPLLEMGNQPAIVNVASMTGRRAMPSWPEYSASKHALVGLTEALRGEMVRFGIDVLLILPGLTKTPFWDDLKLKKGRAELQLDKGMDPSFVAGKIMDAIRKNRTETVVGWDAKWMLRLNRFLPSLVNRLLAKRVKKLYSMPK